MKLIRLLRFIFISGVLFLNSSPVFSINVELIDTSPKSPAVLNQDEALYIHIHYKSNQPLRFQASAKELDKAITDGARFNPSQAYPAGEGEAIAWIAFDKAARIDTITVTVYNANWQPLQTKSMLFSALWETGKTGKLHSLAPWVKNLNEVQQASVGKQEPLTFGSIILVQLLFLSVPVYWLLQMILIYKWTGSWRKMACIPLIISLPLLGYTLFALYADSNLWPLMMIFICPFLLGFLLFVIWYKYVHGRAV